MTRVGRQVEGVNEVVRVLTPDGRGGIKDQVMVHIVPGDGRPHLVERCWCKPVRVGGEVRHQVHILDIP